MKLPDFYNFEALNRVKARMGIPRDVYGSLNVEIGKDRLTVEDLEKLNGTGIDIDFDELTVLPDTTLAYKDRRVLLHIRDVRSISGNYRLPKYHLCNCSTLIDMNESGRFGRYVIATKIDGIFSVRLGGSDLQEIKLDVCRNCLNELNLKLYSHKGLSQKQKDQIVAAFLPDDFFSIYPLSLFRKEPEHDSGTAPVNEYTPDWPQVSHMIRSNAGWCCKQCKANLNASGHRKYLHVHHVNGQRNDNRYENLLVLCIGCHAEQPYHAHIKDLPEYKMFQSLGLRRKST